MMPSSDDVLNEEISVSLTMRKFSKQIKPAVESTEVSPVADFPLVLKHNAVVISLYYYQQVP